MGARCRCKLSQFTVLLCVVHVFMHLQLEKMPKTNFVATAFLFPPKWYGCTPT